ncbi:type III-A CRISPR-associated CARF protein Csm6 [Phascolarctobacterium sp.]
MSILYTPAGDTDPIRDFYDGAILHIIRTYKPSMVRIFLSAEMVKKEETRQVYSKAIAYNAPDCKIEFIKTDIVDAQLMEKLIPLAEGFMELRKEYPNEAILLNLSSGTPQMKTIMSFLATDFDNVRAIQVDSPQQGSNRKAHATQDDEDINAVIENNFDNAEDYKCRCHEAPLALLHRYSVRHQLISLVNSYEYSAALSLYNKNKLFFAEETGKLLLHADLRSKLQVNEAFKATGKPLNNDKEVKLLNEFFMVMELRQKKGDLAEFIVKLTPFLYGLLLYYFEHKAAIKPAQFCYEKQRSNASWKISKRKLQDVAPKAWQYLDDLMFNYGGFRDKTDLSFSNMLNILHTLDGVDSQLLEVLDVLRDVERNHRNNLAHTITNITEELLKNTEPKLSSQELVQKLRKAFMLIMQGENVYKRNVYDDLNQKIAASLDEFRQIK